MITHWKFILPATLMMALGSVNTLGAMPLTNFLQRECSPTQGHQITKVLKDFLKDEYAHVQDSVEIEALPEGRWTLSSPTMGWKVTINDQAYALTLYNPQAREDYKKALEVVRLAAREGLCPPLAYPAAHVVPTTCGTLMTFLPLRRVQAEDLHNQEELERFVHKLKAFHHGDNYAYPRLRDFDQRIQFSLKEAAKVGKKLGGKFFTRPPEAFNLAQHRLRTNHHLSYTQFQGLGLIHRNLNYNNLLVDDETGDFYLGYLDWNEASRGLILEELAVLSLMNRFDAETKDTLLQAYFGDAHAYKKALKGFEEKYYLVLASWAWRQALEKALALGQQTGTDPKNYLMSVSDFNGALETGQWHGEALPSFTQMIDDLAQETMPLARPQDYQKLAAIELRAFFHKD